MTKEISNGVKKILLIEDEPILASMYQEKLSQEGFQVILTSEAKGALKLAKEEKPDLILLDILLPRENGIYFLKELMKEKEIYSIPPVIAFSNYDEPTTKKEALRLGVKNYLIKTNYTPSEIVAKIKQLLSEG